MGKYLFIFGFVAAQSFATSADSIKPFVGTWKGSCNSINNTTTSVEDVTFEILKSHGTADHYLLKLEANGTDKGFKYTPMSFEWKAASKKWEASKHASITMTDYVFTFKSLWGKVMLSNLVLGRGKKSDENRANFALIYNVPGPVQSVTLCEVSRD